MDQKTQPNGTTVLMNMSDRIDYLHIRTTNIERELREIKDLIMVLNERMYRNEL